MPGNHENNEFGRRRGQATAIVVGGGPAGAITARGLAREGWAVTVVERRPEGRGKCCGHCLHPRGVAALGRLGLAAAIAGEPATVGTELWVAGRRGPRTALAGTLGGGTLAPRERFDAELRRAAVEAGVDWIEGSARVEREADAARVEIDGRRAGPATLVIGADGVGSGVARAAGLAPARPGRKFGFSTTLAAAPGGDSTLVTMTLDRDGYVGAVGDGRGSVHLAALVRRDGSREASDPATVIRRFASGFPALRDRLADPRVAGRGAVHATGPLPWRPSSPVGAVALVGDAAGYVEPLTGEGMAWAIESAESLAATIGRLGWNAAGAAAYRRAWRERCAASHARCAIVAALAGRSGAVAALASLRGLGPLAARPLDAVAGFLAARAIWAGRDAVTA